MMHCLQEYVVLNMVSQRVNPSKVYNRRGRHSIVLFSITKRHTYQSNSSHHPPVRHLGSAEHFNVVNALVVSTGFMKEWKTLGQSGLEFEYHYDNFQVVRCDYNGTPYAASSNNQYGDMVLASSAGSGYQLRDNAGMVACAEGHWVVFRPAGACDITVDGSGYASLGGSYLCVDEQGFLNLKNEGYWVKFSAGMYS